MTEPHPVPRSVDLQERVIEDYRSRAEEHARAEALASRAASWTSRARLIVFLASLGVVATLSRSPRLVAIAWIAGVVGGATFVALVRRHRHLSVLVRLHADLRRACENGVD